MSAPTTNNTRLLSTLADLLRQPESFAIYQDSVEAFAQEVLGVTLWEKQVEVLSDPAPRVVCRSGHGVGKTFAMGVLAVWWLYAKHGLVITTGPTKEQVEDVLWRQIHLLLRNAKLPLPYDQLGLTELRINPTWYAVGITTDKPEAFQGRHDPNLLVIVDEAPGVEEHIHQAISTLATGRANKIVMIGNPYSTSGTFYEAFKSPDVWSCHSISCFDHPNVATGTVVIPGAVDREWVERKRQELGEDSPLWYSQVLGQFPSVSTKGVVPLGWVERAFDPVRFEQVRKHDSQLPRFAGLDVARYGANECVFVVRRGDAVEHIESWGHTSLTETAGRAKALMQHWEVKRLVVDESGLGGGVVDILLEQSVPVMGYNGGHRAFRKGAFTNRRSEMWWHLRERFEKKRIVFAPGLGQPAKRLSRDLTAPEYELTSTGRIKVETKEDLLGRGVPSPDYADALVLCFATESNPEKTLELGPEAGRDPTPAAYITGLVPGRDWDVGTGQTLGDGF